MVTGEIPATGVPAAPADDDPRFLRRTGESYVHALEDLAQFLLEEGSLADLLRQILELTSRAVTASAAVSVTIVDADGSYRTVAASSDDARAIDEGQYASLEGPCIDALETGSEQILDDLTEVHRWPHFRERAAEVGVNCAMALPLRLRTEVVGALNVFAAEANGLTEEDRETARRIAAPAAATLANARAYQRVAELAGQLEDALEGRAVIEQAKGVLMAHARCGPDAAFDRLRQTSQQRNQPLRQVAAELVTRAVGEQAAG